MLNQEVRKMAVERRRRMSLEEFLELPEEKPALELEPNGTVVRWERIPRTAAGVVRDGNAELPDLAVEIVSPGQSVNSLVRRSVWYVENGVQIALVVDPDHQSVRLFRAAVNPRLLQGGDSIELGEILPGFALTAEQLFRVLRIEDVSETGR